MKSTQWEPQARGQQSVLLNHEPGKNKPGAWSEKGKSADCGGGECTESREGRKEGDRESTVKAVIELSQGLLSEQ